MTYPSNTTLLTRAIPGKGRRSACVDAPPTLALPAHQARSWQRLLVRSRAPIG
jgi:hypothetical protein